MDVKLLRRRGGVVAVGKQLSAFGGIGVDIHPLSYPYSGYRIRLIDLLGLLSLDVYPRFLVNVLHQVVVLLLQYPSLLVAQVGVLKPPKERGLHLLDMLLRDGVRLAHTNVLQ